MTARNGTPRGEVCAKYTQENSCHSRRCVVCCRGAGGLGVASKPILSMLDRGEHLELGLGLLTYSGPYFM